MHGCCNSRDCRFQHKSGIFDISVFSKKIKLPQVGTKLTTPTFNGSEVRYLFHSATRMNMKKLDPDGLYHSADSIQGSDYIAIFISLISLFSEQYLEI